MRHVTISNLAGCEHVHVTVAGQDARRALDDALALLEGAGASPAHLVRSRLFARDGKLRRAASDLRLELLAGAVRAASSSYIDPSRLPEGANVAFDLVARRGASGEKIVREYEPRIAPPMFVALGGRVYLSGVTDVSEGFPSQLEAIRARVAQSLGEAGTRPDRIAHIAAHVSREVDLDAAWRAIVRAFEAPGAAFTLTQVDGYSAPEKRVEIETTALA